MPQEEKKSLLTRIVERKPPLYWWMLLNISMGCIAVMSWLYFVPTFNYPERPEHYERMITLGRAPSLPAFSAENAPSGSTLDVEKVHQLFTSNELSDNDLEELNNTFLRNYIQQIKLKKFNYYIKGKFKVVQTRELTKDDLFTSGIVVRARSQRTIGANHKLVPFLVDIEYILPGVDAAELDYFSTGKLFNIYKVPHYCTILHVNRNTGSDGETVVYLTIAPLVVSPPLHLSQGKTITLTPPERIFPANSLPIFK